MRPTEKELRKKISVAQNRAVRNRAYRRGRERALTRLAQAHREEYLVYLAEEKTKDEQAGQRWAYDTGNPVDLWNDIASFHADTNRGNSSVNSQDKGDNL